MFLYDNLNCLKWKCFWHWNCVLMINWIVWNRNCFICIKMDLVLITYNVWCAIKPNQTKPFLWGKNIHVILVPSFLCLKLNVLEKSTNKRVRQRVFARILSMIHQIVSLWGCRAISSKAVLIFSLKLFCFVSDTIEVQSIVNFSS